MLPCKCVLKGRQTSRHGIRIRIILVVVITIIIVIILVVIMIITIIMIIIITTTTIATIITIMMMTIFIQKRFPAHDELGTCRTSLVFPEQACIFQGHKHPVLICGQI